MVAYGPFSVLDVTISWNKYRVEYPASAGEAMIIDSRRNGQLKGRAYLQKQGNQEINVFDYRAPQYQIFKKIPPGMVTIDYSREHGIDLSVFLERSEPIWN